MQEHGPTSGDQPSVETLNVPLLSRLERTTVMDGVIRAPGRVGRPGGWWASASSLLCPPRSPDGPSGRWPTAAPGAWASPTPQCRAARCWSSWVHGWPGSETAPVFGVRLARLGGFGLVVGGFLGGHMASGRRAEATVPTP